LIFVGAAAVVMTGSALAQDARTVTEPVIPSSCAILDAKLIAIAEGPYKTLASADEAKLDTTRIQNALDTCPKGKAVVLRTHGSSNAFVSGPLELREGVKLVIDRSATLFTSINPALFELAPGSCGVVNTSKGPGCKPFISVKSVSGAGIMGEGVIDGRGGIKLIGSGLSAWEIGQRSNPGAKKLSRLIVADHADDFTLYNITLRNSPNFNVSYSAGNGFTVWGVKIDTPRRSPKTTEPLSRNTDGIDPGSGAKNITITHSYIRVGDDNVAIKGGTGGATNMTISHNHFYWGHGMSIGSQTFGGVSKIRVFDLTLDGTDSGLRIKSAGDRGGVVSDVIYEDICIRNSQRPVDISAAYKANNAVEGSRPPVYRDITLRNVQIEGGGQFVFEGSNPDNRAAITLDGVFTTDARPYRYALEHADVIAGPSGSNLSLPNNSMESAATVGHVGAKPACANRFVPFPTSP
jgi:polygalacturonase